jgi:membrane-associated phospholipid phosphatase
MGHRAWPAIAVAAVACYALLWCGWALNWQWLRTFDAALLNPLHRYGVHHRDWVRGWDVLCTVLGPGGLRLVGLVVAVIAAVQRNVRVILLMLTAIGLSGVVTQAAKDLADRPRPASAFTEAASTSFPSGHAVAVMAAVLALLAVSWDALTRRNRTAAIAAGAVTVIAVGAGRVVLNVHYPSDVLAGWALGVLWFLACYLVIRPRPVAGELTAAAETSVKSPPGL